MTNKDESISVFHHPLNIPQLPEEVIRNVISYMDITSMANIIQTSRQTTESLFSTLLLSDQIWAKFVEARFKIKCERRRPKTYGGATWKTAYRSLMTTNRVPRNRLVTGNNNQKVVFAKPFFGNYEKRCNKYAAYLSGRKSNETVAPSSLGAGLWVTIGHTENRNTRITSGRRWMSSEGKSVRNRNSRYGRETGLYADEERQRYIELHLCLQNTKSSGGTFSADFANAHSQVVYCRGGVCEINEVNVKSGGEFGPKLLYHSRYDRSENNAKKANVDDIVDGIDSLNENAYHSFDLTLEAFEFAVVAVNIPCPSGMVFETDFLSQAILMNVPVTVNERTASNGCARALDPHFAGVKDGNSTWLASAAFLGEDDIWKYYMELPGGFLAAVDPSSMRD